MCHTAREKSMAGALTKWCSNFPIPGILSSKANRISLTLDASVVIFVGKKINKEFRTSRRFIIRF